MKKFIDFSKEILENEHLQIIRAIASEVGVKAPTAKSKNQLIEEIVAIQQKQLEPVEPSKKGAPKKMKNIDLSCYYVDDDLPYEKASESTYKIIFEDSGKDSYMVEGILEIQNGNTYGFLRVKNYTNSDGDVHVSADNIKKFNLRKGDKVKAVAKRNNNASAPTLEDVYEVNEIKFIQPEKRAKFDDFKSEYPTKKFNLTLPTQDLSLRCIDLFSPIGFGQRGLIVAPPKTGKTTLLKQLAAAIEHNHKNVKVLVLLVDERPEEVSDFRRSIFGEVICSTFDESYEHHVRVAELVLNRAKRLVEQGEDVVILLDSITRLARAYNNVVTPSGRTLSGGLDPMAMQGPKQFFGSARAVEGGGSLTVIATALIETESRMDEVIFEEFKGTGNMELRLSRELSERRIFPAIDLFKSGTRKEDLLLSTEQLETAYKLRRTFSNRPNSTEVVFEMLTKSKDNDDLAKKLDAWLKIYNK